ncbi:MAG TPA: hypothetical protein VHE35_19705 [Kofleriaceae bacterium]|nr:hypothetical protein [Kofleriaceae bacterium]
MTRSITLLGAMTGAVLLLPTGAAQAAPPGNACSSQQKTSCAATGGVAEQIGVACACVTTVYTPRQVVNADDGDVGLVPILEGSTKGDPIVRTALSSAGQLHRHAVMFHDSGRKTRHDTMYFADGDDGSTADAGGAYITVHAPLVGEIHLDEDELRNGTPGAITQTVDDTYARGRLEDTGLVLKPRQLCLVNPFNGVMSCSEPDRAAFAGAVSDALTLEAYYKLSDYTDQDSMSKPFSLTRVGDLRGSHCSGYIAANFIGRGLAIAPVHYDQPLRDLIANDVFDETRDEARAGTNFWKDFLAAVTLHWSGPTNVANQVVNCFAGFDCGDTSDTWAGGTGDGDANSPDNLLPVSFKLSGTASYEWTTGLVHVNDTVSNPNGTATTPFRRVEAMVMTGGYTTQTVKFTW